MAQAKNASTVSLHLPNSTVRELSRRAAQIGYTRSKYAATLVQRWFSRGAEPILAIEKELLVPSVRPDGSKTWVGAELRSGSNLTDFADEDVGESLIAVAEDQAPYEAGPAPKKTAKGGRVSRPAPTLRAGPSQTNAG